MESFKLFPQEDLGQVRVDLCRQYRYMSKKLLNDTEVCAILQQMRCKAMSQHVGLYMSQACTTRGSINYTSDVAQRERPLRLRIAKPQPSRRNLNEMRGESRLSSGLILQQRKSIVKFVLALGRGAIANYLALVTPLYGSVRLFLVLAPVTPPRAPLP